MALIVYFVCVSLFSFIQSSDNKKGIVPGIFLCHFVLRGHSPLRDFFWDSNVDKAGFESFICLFSEDVVLSLDGWMDVWRQGGGGNQWGLSQINRRKIHAMAGH